LNQIREARRSKIANLIATLEELETVEDEVEYCYYLNNYSAVKNPGRSAEDTFKDIDRDIDSLTTRFKMQIEQVRKQAEFDGAKQSKPTKLHPNMKPFCRKIDNNILDQYSTQDRDRRQFSKSIPDDADNYS
jgi:Mg-chelatase subunit ChlI